LGSVALPALIALVVYGIMPIYQNTYSGLRSVDPNLEEAATAFGLSRWKKLTRLELPMALPVILSGIRISLVMIIGTATLCCFDWCRWAGEPTLCWGSIKTTTPI
jgi:osmoprotectant transport system permease protein